MDTRERKGDCNNGNKFEEERKAIRRMYSAGFITATERRYCLHRLADVFNKKLVEIANAGGSVDAVTIYTRNINADVLFEIIEEAEIIR